MNVLRSCAVATALLLYDSQRTSRALAAAPHQLLASKHRLDASCTHLNGGRSAVNLTRFDTFSHAVAPLGATGNMYVPPRNP